MSDRPPLTEAQTRRIAHGLATLCGVTNISRRTRLVTAVYEDPVLRAKLQDTCEGFWEKLRSMSKKQTS